MLTKILLSIAATLIWLVILIFLPRKKGTESRVRKFAYFIGYIVGSMTKKIGKVLAIILCIIIAVIIIAIPATLIFFLI